MPSTTSVGTVGSAAALKGLGLRLRDGVCQEKSQNYRPRIMRPWCLCIFAVLPLIMIGATEGLLQTSIRHISLFSHHNKSLRSFRNILAQFFGLIALAFMGRVFNDLDLAVKKMEPFYQLSKPGGANGWDSLCVDYFRPLLYFTPIIAVRHKHWAVLYSSLAAIISTNVLTTLALCMFITDEHKETAMDPIYTRMFEGFLGSLSLLAFVLALLLQRRESGLEGYPSGYDALIKFTSHRDTGNSLYALFDEQNDDEMSEEKLKAIVGPLRFRLQRLEGKGGSSGIVQIESASLSGYQGAWDWYGVWPKKGQVVFADPRQIFRTTLVKSFQAFIASWHGFRAQWLYTDNHPMIFQTIPLFGATSILLMLFVLANGQPFWAARSVGFFISLGGKRFARSTVSTVINTIIWAQINKNAKLMEPIYLLRDGTSQSVLSLEYPEGWPFRDLYYFFATSKKLPKAKGTDYVILVLILGRYASSLFVVAWNLLGLSCGGFDPGFWVSLGMMIVCELVMLAALATIIIYRRRPFLPRQPTTLASNLLFVYATDIILEPTIPPQTPHTGVGSLDTQMLSVEIRGQMETQQSENLAAASAGAIPRIDPERRSPAKPNEFPLEPVSEWVQNEEDQNICTFNKFIGRDGKPHVGIGKLIPGQGLYVFGNDSPGMV